MTVKDISDLTVCVAIAERVRRQSRGAYAGASRMLCEITCRPRKVCERAIERAASRGLIEWGSHLERCWLTASGESLLSRRP